MSAISASRGAYRETADGSLEVKIIIDPRFKDEFHRLFREKDMPVALAPLVADFESLPKDQGISVEQDKVSDSGHWVSALYKSGWWFYPKVLAALGSDKQYREWVQLKPSCVSNQFGEYVDGEGRSVAAHVRRAGESGTGYKAPYACVPLTDAEHQLQHNKGESAFDGGAKWFDAQLAKYKTEWAHAQLRRALGVESLTDARQSDFISWVSEHELNYTLPLALRS